MLFRSERKFDTLDTAVFDMIAESGGNDTHTNAAAMHRIKASGNMNHSTDLFFAGARAELTQNSGSGVSARVHGEVALGSIAKMRAGGDITAESDVSTGDLGETGAGSGGRTQDTAAGTAARVHDEDAVGSVAKARACWGITAASDVSTGARGEPGAGFSGMTQDTAAGDRKSVV